jgi:hypothetical protein
MRGYIFSKTAIDFFVLSFVSGGLLYALASFVWSFFYEISFFKLYFLFLILLLVVVFYFLIKLDFSSYKDQEKGDNIIMIVGIIAPFLIIILGFLVKGFIYFFPIQKIGGIDEESIFKLGTVVINLLSIIGLMIYTDDEKLKYCRTYYSLADIPKKVKVVAFLISLIPFAILDDILLYLTKQINLNFQIANQETVLSLLFLSFFGIQFYLAFKLRGFLLKKSVVKREEDK